MADFNVAQCLMNDGGYSTDEMQDILAAAEEDESVLVQYLSDDVEIDSRPVKTCGQREIIVRTGWKFMPSIWNCFWTRCRAWQALRGSSVLFPYLRWLVSQTMAPHRH